MFVSHLVRGSYLCRTLLSFAAILSLAAAIAPEARAQCDFTWAAAASGNWFNGGGTNNNWSPSVNNGPNSSGSSVCITDGTSTVTMNAGASVLNLSVGTNNTLAVGGNTITVNGTSIANGGLITLGNGNLTLGGSSTLSGGGTVSMSSDVVINQNTAGLTLTNADNLIEGTGQLGQNGLSFNNQAAGTVNANTIGGTLTMNGGGAIGNAGALKASNGGILTINNTVTNSGLGNITADGGTVNLASTINGGTLNIINSGTMNGNGATLVGVTLSAGSTFTNGGGTTHLQGVITNNGTFTSPNGNFTIDNNVTLSGGGTVSMSQDTFFNQSSGGLTLTNTNNLIQGTGQLGQNGMSFNNQAAGTVNANISGGTLTMNGAGAIGNAGTLKASNGGILTINNTVTNSGLGNITADGGTVNLASTIKGGTLNVINSGTMNGNGATLVGVTLSAGSTFTNGGGTTHLQDVITNNGTFTSPNGTYTIDNNVTLSGGGTVSMSQDAFFNQSSGGLTLTNSDNTIQGTGQLGQNGMALVNGASGTVNANVSGGTLTLNGGGLVTNNGLLTATSGGTLSVANNVTNNASIVANGGSVQFGSMTVTGGTLSTQNSGTMGGNGTVLNSLTLSSGSSFNDNGTVFLEGAINNQGTITVPNNTLTITGGDVTLSGGGVVSMSRDAFFNQNSGGLTLHNLDNTIEGTGQLGQNGMSLANGASGTVNANVSGGTLTLNGGGLVTNNGLLTATNGGTLAVVNNVTNNTSIVANGGSVQFGSMTVTGGTLSTQNSGTMGGNGTVLNSLTLSSGSSFNDNGTVFLEGAIKNQGTITVPNNTLTITGGGVTLSGGGVVSMSSDAFFNQNSGGLTLHNLDNTIQGTGQLGQNGMSIANGGTILANVNGGTLTVNGGGTLSNSGTLQVGTLSTLDVSNNLTNFSGSTLSGGTYRSDGGTMILRSLGNGGGEVVDNGATVVLSGATAQIVDNSGLNAFSRFQDNLSDGSFTVENGQRFVTTSNGHTFQNDGSMVVGDGSSFTTAGDYRQGFINADPPSTQVDGTLSAVGGSVDIIAGTLSGSGTVVGNTTIEGGATISANDPADFHIIGDLTISGMDVEQIGGATEPGGWSRLIISGTADLTTGSDLDLSLLNGFMPANGAQFDIIDAGGLTGPGFSTVNGMALVGDAFTADGENWTIDYDTADGKVVLDAVSASGPATPEPEFYLPIVGIAVEMIRRKIKARQQSRIA